MPSEFLKIQVWLSQIKMHCFTTNMKISYLIFTEWFIFVKFTRRAFLMNTDLVLKWACVFQNIEDMDFKFFAVVNQRIIRLKMYSLQKTVYNYKFTNNGWWHRKIHKLVSNIQWNLLRRTSHKTGTSLRRTLPHVPAERRCVSHRKTSIKTNTLACLGRKEWISHKKPL